MALRKIARSLCCCLLKKKKKKFLLCTVKKPPSGSWCIQEEEEDDPLWWSITEKYFEDRFCERFSSKDFSKIKLESGRAIPKRDKSKVSSVTIDSKLSTISEVSWSDCSDDDSKVSKNSVYWSVCSDDDEDTLSNISSNQSEEPESRQIKKSLSLPNIRIVEAMRNLDKYVNRIPLVKNWSHFSLRPQNRKAAESPEEDQASTSVCSLMWMPTGIEKRWKSSALPPKRAKTK